MIDWNTFAAALLPLGITALIGGANVRARTLAHAATIREVKETIAEHIKEDNAVHGDVREMKSDIRWIRETLERMERR